MRVMTLGTFDLFHRGHLRLLERAYAFGDLIVGVNTDEFVTQYKGKPPAEDLERRMHNVFQCPFVSITASNEGPGCRLIREFRPDLLVIGSDWHDHYLPQIGVTAEELFSELHCGVTYLPRTPDISTSALRSDAA